MTQSQEDHKFDWVTRRKQLFVRDHFALFLIDVKDAVEKRNSQGPFPGASPGVRPWDVSEESPEKFWVHRRDEASVIIESVQFEMENGRIKITGPGPLFETIIVRPEFQQLFGNETVSYVVFQEIAGEPVSSEEYLLRWRILEKALGDLFFNI